MHYFRLIQLKIAFHYILNGVDDIWFSSESGLFLDCLLQTFVPFFIHDIVVVGILYDIDNLDQMWALNLQ